MKTRIIIIAASAALITSAYAWVQCNVCKGSGWNGPQKCYPCGGDGKIGQ